MAMHYGLRLIERRQQESWNFISHFMHIQIFQMEISSLSLILIAPKYSRQICRGRNKYISIFLFNFTVKCKKKGDELNSVKYFTQKLVRRYLHRTISTFKLEFHLEDGLVEQRYFELFFSAWSIFSSYKRSLLNEAVFTLFYICFNFGHICCTEVIHFFSVENLGHQELKKSSKYELMIFLDEKQRFTFAIFLSKGRPQPIVHWQT